MYIYYSLGYIYNISIPIQMYMYTKYAKSDVITYKYEHSSLP